MNINASPKNFYTRPTRVKSMPQPAEATSSDSVTLGSTKDLFKNVGRGLAMGALGAIPAVGAFTNGVGSFASGAGDLLTNEFNSAPGDAAGLGAVANVAGTLGLVAGALTGNQTAMNVSYGLLGASALAGVYLGVAD